jgi:hypothetical protein
MGKTALTPVRRFSGKELDSIRILSTALRNSHGGVGLTNHEWLAPKMCSMPDECPEPEKCRKAIFDQFPPFR